MPNKFTNYTCCKYSVRLSFMAITLDIVHQIFFNIHFIALFAALYTINFSLFWTGLLSMALHKGILFAMYTDCMRITIYSTIENFCVCVFSLLTFVYLLLNLFQFLHPFHLFQAIPHIHSKTNMVQSISTQVNSTMFPCSAFGSQHKM